MTRIALSELIAAAGEQMWVPASWFTLAAGGPTYGQVGNVSSRRSPAWLFADSSEQSIAVILDLPVGWSSIDIYAVWVNPNAGAGDVVWRADTSNLYELSSVDSETVGTQATATAPTQFKIAITQVGADAVFDPSGLNRVEISRLNDAADTLVGNAALLGVFLRRSPVPTNWLRE